MSTPLEIYLMKHASAGERDVPLWRAAMEQGLAKSGSMGKGPSTALITHLMGSELTKEASTEKDAANALGRWIRTGGTRASTYFKDMLNASRNAAKRVDGAPHTLAEAPTAIPGLRVVSRGSGLDDDAYMLARRAFSPNRTPANDFLSKSPRDKLNSYRAIKQQTVDAARNKTRLEMGLPPVSRPVKLTRGDILKAHKDPAWQQMSNTHRTFDVDRVLQSDASKYIDETPWLQKAPVPAPRSKLDLIPDATQIPLAPGESIRGYQVGVHNATPNLSTRKSDWGQATAFGGTGETLPNAHVTGIPGAETSLYSLGDDLANQFKGTTPHPRLANRRTVRGFSSVLDDSVNKNQQTAKSLLQVLEDRKGNLAAEAGRHEPWHPVAVSADKAIKDTGAKIQEVASDMRANRPVYVPPFGARILEKKHPIFDKPYVHPNGDETVFNLSDVGGKQLSEMLTSELPHSAITRSYAHMNSGKDVAEWTPALQYLLGRRKEKIKSILLTNPKIRGLHESGAFNIDDFLANNIALPKGM